MVWFSNLLASPCCFESWISGAGHDLSVGAGPKLGIGHPVARMDAGIGRTSRCLVASPAACTACLALMGLLWRYSDVDIGNSQMVDNETLVVGVRKIEKQGRKEKKAIQNSKLIRVETLLDFVTCF